MLPSLGSFLGLLLGMHLVDDLYFYWNHRMLHTPWMWENVHAFHHQLKEPTALSTSYIHPFEMILVSIGACVRASGPAHTRAAGWARAEVGWARAEAGRAP